MSITRLLWITLLLPFSGHTFVAHGFSAQRTQRHQHQCHPSSYCPPSPHNLQPAWSSTSTISTSTTSSRRRHRSSTSTSLSVIGTGVASILAGSVGGAIGVGVAYPLDTLKTKSQVYGQQRAAERKARKNQSSVTTTTTTTTAPKMMENSTAAAALPPGLVCNADDVCIPIESAEDDLISLVKLILEVEGVAGFFGGVKAMMIGQALIKSVAFSANELALGVLKDSNLLGVATIVGSSSAS
eukprot:CAMPEP_0201663640 /NCGR_PEP_ID=MMETSP0494-20130426/5370_1 /ASSEMBLY_ACC=CAM_ASM_000839 /TAXON_ID=420259 /ORGANISM="Thalassiosira gravida, Strain GMp14c1" /LENGTH=240 /DNA_ID=CAMNT_0048142271 /DNA_START=82 /DNA_END=801 /DNA_ORIENTATION=-